VTQVGEGQGAGDSAPSLMTFGAPEVGEILAERYELAEHINDDSAGRQVWRGVDVVLRRPVAVILRYPGGDSATAMLQSAVTASRVVHPNLAGVYDAIDEGERAYVVREWVSGRSLREIVAEGVLDPAHAAGVAHAVAAALSAVHATSMVHGNVHPGTVMISDDGRVVLADGRSDVVDTQETDVRAVGGILYFALTGRWPYAEAPMLGATAGQGRAAVADAIRDGSGSAAAPRQVRAGIPSYLDELTTALLDPQAPQPTAEALAAELGSLDALAEEPEPEGGPLRFAAAVDDEPSALGQLGNRKLLLSIGGGVAAALIALLVGVTVLTPGDDPAPGPVAQTSAGTDPSETPGDSSPAQIVQIAIGADQVRVVDPPGGDRDELRDIEKVVDGDTDGGWFTHKYFSPKFGNVKAGMGIFIDLGEPRMVKSVTAELSAAGASAELYSGSINPPSTTAGDQELFQSYRKTPVGAYERHDGTTMTFSDFDPDQEYRYLLLWFTELPATSDGGFQVGVQEIIVRGQ